MLHEIDGTQVDQRQPSVKNNKHGKQASDQIHESLRA